MAVDLADYTDNLQREVNAPGADSWPTATDAEWLGQLADAFWEARVDGLLEGFTCDADGLVTPVVPAGVDPATQPDMGRDMVQLVILYASFRVIRNTLREMQTLFVAQAGSVRYETAHSASLLVEIMKDIVARRDVLLVRLSDLGSSSVMIIDAITARDQSMLRQTTYWVASGDMLPAAYQTSLGT